MSNMSGQPSGIGNATYARFVPQRPQKDLRRPSEELNDVKKESLLTGPGVKTSTAGSQMVLSFRRVGG